MNSKPTPPFSDQVMQEMLKQLGEVEAPASTFLWWTPALGWWLLIILLCTSTWVLFHFGIRYRVQQKYYRELITNLNKIYNTYQQNQQTAVYLQAVNSLIKQAAIYLVGRKETAHLQGNYWLNFLTIGYQAPSESVGYALTQASYQPNASIDIEQVHTYVYNWIKNHKHRRYNNWKLDSKVTVNA